MSEQNKPQSARRNFLARAAGTAAGTAAVAFPSISVAQSPITLRFQGVNFDPTTNEFFSSSRLNVPIGK